MTRSNIWNRLIVAFFVIVAVIGGTTAISYADALDAIQLDANNGSVDIQSVQATEDNKLPDLPNPERTGWTFEGWYTGPVTERVSFEDPTNAGTYWRWDVQSTGHKVQAGDSAADIDTLYAMYKPTNISFKIYPAGWMGKTGVMSTGREYGVPFSGIVYGWLDDDDPGQTDGDYVFDGWYDQQVGGTQVKTVGAVPDGTEYESLGEYTPLTGQDMWMHWHLQSNPEVTQATYEKFEYTDATGLIAGINESGLRCTSNIEAKATVYPEGKTNVKTLEWTTDRTDLLEIQGTGLSVTLKAKGIAGVATVTAKIPNTEYTSTFHVNIYHNMNSGKVIKSGGCTDPETIQYTCKDCNYSETKELPAPGHRYVTHEYYASCTEPGHTTRICRVCGHHEDEQTQPALGHNYVTRQIDSCGGREILQTCTNCGTTITDKDETQIHHSWKTDYTIDKPATCNTEGSKSIHCENCEVTKDTISIPVDSTKHTYTSWNTVREPTATEFGERERHCTVCGNVETEQIAKIQEDIPYIEPELSPEPEPSTPPSGGNTGGNTGSGNGGNTGGGNSGTKPDPTPTPDPEEPGNGDTPENPEPEDPGTGNEPENPGENPGVTPEPENPTPSNPTTHDIIVYRLYDKVTGAHLLSTDENEVKTLVAKGWKNEGQAYTMNDTQGVPVYRLYDKSSCEHIYTVDTNERDGLVKAGWTNEGIVCYSAKSGTPVYRLFNDGNAAIASHLFTSDENEYKELKNYGWKQEGIAYFTY